MATRVLPTATASCTFAGLLKVRNNTARSPGELDAIRPTQAGHYFAIVHDPPAVAASINF